MKSITPYKRPTGRYVFNIPIPLWFVKRYPLVYETTIYSGIPRHYGWCKFNDFSPLLVERLQCALITSGSGFGTIVPIGQKTEFPAVQEFPIGAAIVYWIK